MLWVDDDFVKVDDLLSIEPELSEIAKTEQLTLEGDNGLLRRAKEDAQTHLAQFMSLSNLSFSDLTLRNVVTPSYNINRTYAGFAQLVVSGDTGSHWNPLKQWAVDRALLRIYRAAINRNTDRYQERYDAVQERLTVESWPKFKRFGLPIVMNPLVAPGAIMERAGEFGSSNISLTGGSGTSVDEVDVAIAWTAEDGDESYRSRLATISLVNGQVLQVNINGLTPPNGVQPKHTEAYCRYTPKAAAGWNVYVGKRNGKLYRQNGSPIPVATSTYTLSGNPVYSGTEAGLGQVPDINLEITSNLRRC